MNMLKNFASAVVYVRVCVRCTHSANAEELQWIVSEDGLKKLPLLFR